jgi:TPR repeat protein
LDACLAFDALARQGNRQAKYYLGMVYDYGSVKPRVGFEHLVYESGECALFFDKFKSEEHRHLGESHLENGRRYEIEKNLTEATCHYLMAAQYGSVDAYWHLGFLETIQKSSPCPRINYWFQEWRKWSGSGGEQVAEQCVAWSDSEYEENYPFVLYWLMRNPQEERIGLFSASIDETKLFALPPIHSHWPLEEQPGQEQLAKALYSFSYCSRTSYDRVGDTMSVKYLLESAKLGYEKAKRGLCLEYSFKKVLPFEYKGTLTRAVTDQKSDEANQRISPDVEIALLTACYYLYRGGVDVAKGRELLGELGERGIGQAYYLLALSLANDPEINASESIDSYLAKAVEHGEHVASGYQGWRYHFGIGVEQNSDRARYHYEQAARHGSWESSYIGLIALKAAGISGDLLLPDSYPKENIWTQGVLDLAYEKRNPHALYALGVMFEKGIGVLQSYLIAAARYKDANQPDLHQARLRVGRLACKDDGNTPSYNNQLLKLFQKIPPDAGQIYDEARFEIAYLLAQQRDFGAAAQPHRLEYEIALHYHQAIRTKRMGFEDKVGAARIKELAAKVNPERLYEVAMQYQQFSLTNEERSKYLSLAAQLGHPNAAFELYLLAKSPDKGNIQLLREKISWLKLAAKLGNEKARQIIGEESLSTAKYLIDNREKNASISGYFDDINRCLRIAQVYKNSEAKSLVAQWHVIENAQWEAELDTEEQADLSANQKAASSYKLEYKNSAAKLHGDL